MIKRPKPTDDEHDIMKMQQEFLAEKEKNDKFQPAAKVVRVNNEKSSSGKKVSQFAQRRGIAKEEPKVAEKNRGIVFGEILEKPETFGESPTNSVKSIIELDLGFPRVEKISATDDKVPSKKSIFAQRMEKKKLAAVGTKSDEDRMEVDIQSGEPSSSCESDFRQEIHEENLTKLEMMSAEEILAERQELFSSLDPAMIEFLKSRRKGGVEKKKEPPPPPPNREEEKKVDIPDIEMLADLQSHSWLNFNVVESEKFEWMKNIPETSLKLKPGEEYEARFDWKGFLLPYTEGEITEANRDLYLHGDDAHRPGYTLQEIFRLARSTVIQQRISALNSIAGLLNIYNQGYYDRALELPLTKIFFLLRFSLDDNTVSVLDATTNAMATLFYNDIDETLLDVISESHHSTPQPFLKTDSDLKKNSTLENELEAMSIDPKDSRTFKTDIDEDTMSDISSMNDFHLAETDLVECLLRTNILERIRYIVETIRPETSTIIGCIKILIRVARSAPENIEKILSTDRLIGKMVEYFVPTISTGKGGGDKTKFYGKPQAMMVKLLRVMALGGGKFFNEIRRIDGLEDAIRSYVFLQEDLNESIIQLQIETLRLVKVWAIYNPNDDVIRSIHPALRFFLEWHYQFLEFHQGGHFLIRQHAASMISLIGLSNHIDFINLFASIFVRCFNKWCDLASRPPGIREFSQSILLTSCVETSKLLLDTGNADFKFLENFIRDTSFDDFTKDMCKTSALLMFSRDRSKIHPPLPNFGVVVYPDGESISPSLIFHQNYNFVFLNSLIETYPNLIISNEHVLEYLERISVLKVNPDLQINWFLRFELKFLMNCLRKYYNFQNQELLFQIGYKIINYLTGIFSDDINFVFESILFNYEFYQSSSSAENNQLLNNCKQDYLELLTDAISMNLSTSPNNWTEIVVPSYWPYMPLFVLYQTHQNPQPISIDEERLIKMTLIYTRFLETKISNILTPIDHLVHMMLPYFSNEAKFLDEDIKWMIGVRKARLEGCTFDFDVKFMSDKISFEVFYIAFLEQFQSMGYGDETFSALVMVPLQQKYDAKWRKRIWSEHVVVLRFISCDEKGLIGSIDEYLNPPETDVSLLRCYNAALKSNMLRPGSIPYRIAEFHVNEHLAKIKK